MSTNNNERNFNDQPNTSKNYPGFSGVYGTNSKIHDIWLEHFETGFWIGDYSTTVVTTSALDISQCRIRNTYADGVNFTQGTSNSFVEYSSIRNCGDDGLAIWPYNQNKAPMTKNDIFRYCTIEHVWRAGGIGIFGGEGHQVNNCIIKDGFESAGIRFTTDFAGYAFSTNISNPMHLNYNTIIDDGTTADLWNNSRGAIEFNATGAVKDICYIQFTETKIIAAQQHGIQFEGNGGKFYNITFYNTTIDSTGINGSAPADGIYCTAASSQAEFDYVIFKNIISQDSYNANPGTFNLIINFPGQLGIGTISPKDAFNVYYSPMLDAIQVKGDMIKVIRVYDISGRKLLEKENSSKQSDFSINTNGLINGIYLIQAETQTHGLVSGKIIKY